MRTTVTLDDDVTTAIARLQSERRATFREVLNDLVREGLAARARRARDDNAPMRTTQARAMGPRFASFDRTSEIIAALEGDTYK